MFIDINMNKLYKFEYVTKHITITLFKLCIHTKQRSAHISNTFELHVTVRITFFFLDTYMYCSSQLGLTSVLIYMAHTIADD